MRYLSSFTRDSDFGVISLQRDTTDPGDFWVKTTSTATSELFTTAQPETTATAKQPYDVDTEESCHMHKTYLLLLSDPSWAS